MKKFAPPNASRSVGKPTHGRILTAALKAFMHKGYSATSTLEIATRAKVSKRDLYANFGNKQAMLLACIQSRATRMRLPHEVQAPRSRATLAATLTALGITVLREVSHPQVIAMYRLAIAEAKRSPEIAETLNASRSANRTALADLLAEAQKARILRSGGPQKMMEQFFSLLWGDLLLSLLFDVTRVLSAEELGRRARGATEAFMALYANPNGAAE